MGFLNTPYWTLFPLWALPGVGLMLLVLAQRPHRYVGAGAVLFAIGCVVIGGVLAIDAHQQLVQQKELMACIRKNGVKSATVCSKLFPNSKFGFIGNESYAGE